MPLRFLRRNHAIFRSSGGVIVIGFWYMSGQVWWTINSAKASEVWLASLAIRNYSRLIAKKACGVSEIFRSLWCTWLREALACVRVGGRITAVFFCSAAPRSEIAAHELPCSKDRSPNWPSCRGEVWLPRADPSLDWSLTLAPGERIRRFFFLLLNGILLTGEFPYWAETGKSLTPAS